MVQRAALTALRIPTAVLHDHLDGGLRISTVIELAEQIGWQLPTLDPVELQAWFTRGADSKDLLAYLATFEHTLAVMQNAESITRVAREAVEDLAADGVVYAEIRCAPELHQRDGLSLTEVVSAVTHGFAQGEKSARDRGQIISAFLICCAMRTEQRSSEIAQMVADSTDPRVVAFDLAGAETGFPPGLHAEALQIAREAHLNITIHASEPPDLELISDAVSHGAHRIGHGVRLWKDVEFATDPHTGQRTVSGLGPLAQHILDRQIHLEMAPTCNVQIGAVDDLAHHPIGPFLRAGFNVGINTDNRLMSHVMPSSELLAVATTFDLGWSEIRQLTVNAIRSGFAPYDARMRIIAEQVDPFFAEL
jgi:adenosine deaminase